VKAVRVLIVDDSRAMRQYVRGILRENPDLRVEEVASGFEAFKVLARESFELVITDLNMPDLNGLDLVRFIKTTARHAKTKIIVMTTQIAEKTRSKLLDFGVDGYVTKPFDPGTITELVEALGGAEEKGKPVNGR
jgi:two-component system, chemotaxis family, chemotaxis protein CheY